MAYSLWGQGVAPRNTPTRDGGSSSGSDRAGVSSHPVDTASVGEGARGGRWGDGRGCIRSGNTGSGGGGRGGEIWGHVTPETSEVLPLLECQKGSNFYRGG